MYTYAHLGSILGYFGDYFGQISQHFWWLGGTFVNNCVNNFQLTKLILSTICQQFLLTKLILSTVLLIFNHIMPIPNPFLSSISIFGCTGRWEHLVAPHRAIPRDYLSDTPLLRAMGVFGVSTWPIGCDTPAPFFSISPWESMRSGGAIPPPPLKRGVSAILARYPMKTRQMGAIRPSAMLSRKGIARYGGVSCIRPLSENIRSGMIPHDATRLLGGKIVWLERCLCCCLGCTGYKWSVKRRLRGSFGAAGFHGSTLGASIILNKMVSSEGALKQTNTNLKGTKLAQRQVSKSLSESLQSLCSICLFL